MQKEIRLDTENENIKIVQRARNGLLEVIREITSTSGEIEEDTTEIRKTIETITITRITTFTT